VKSDLRPAGCGIVIHRDGTAIRTAEAKRLLGDSAQRVSEPADQASGPGEFGGYLVVRAGYSADLQLTGQILDQLCLPVVPDSAGIGGCT